MILNRWFKLDKSVEKSREGIFARIASIFEQPRAIDDDLWEELEELLLQADVGGHGFELGRGLIHALQRRGNVLVGREYGHVGLGSQAERQD